MFAYNVYLSLKVNINSKAWRILEPIISSTTSAFNLEVFDRVRQLNVLKVTQAFDFTTGEKLKLQVLNVNEPKRAEMIVDAIDAFIEQVLVSSK